MFTHVCLRLLSQTVISRIARFTFRCRCLPLRRAHTQHLSQLFEKTIKCGVTALHVACCCCKSGSLRVLLLLLDAGDARGPTATQPAFADCLQAPTRTPPMPTATRRSCTGSFNPTVFSQRLHPNVTAQLPPEQRRVRSGPASARRQPQHQKLVRANGNSLL